MSYESLGKEDTAVYSGTTHAAAAAAAAATESRLFGVQEPPSRKRTTAADAAAAVAPVTGRLPRASFRKAQRGGGGAAATAGSIEGEKSSAAHRNHRIEWPWVKPVDNQQVYMFSIV